MDIAALSIGLSQMKVSQQVSLATMKLAMEQATQQSESVLKAVATSGQIAVDPHRGRVLDIRA